MSNSQAKFSVAINNANAQAVKVNKLLVSLQNEAEEQAGFILAETKGYATLVRILNQIVGISAIPLARTENEATNNLALCQATEDTINLCKKTLRDQMTFCLKMQSEGEEWKPKKQSSAPSTTRVTPTVSSSTSSTIVRPPVEDSPPRYEDAKNAMTKSALPLYPSANASTSTAVRAPAEVTPPNYLATVNEQVNTLNQTIAYLQGNITHRMASVPAESKGFGKLIGLVEQMTLIPPITPASTIKEAVTTASICQSTAEILKATELAFNEQLEFCLNSVEKPVVSAPAMSVSSSSAVAANKTTLFAYSGNDQKLLKDCQDQITLLEKSHQALLTYQAAASSGKKLHPTLEATEATMHTSRLHHDLLNLYQTLVALQTSAPNAGIFADVKTAQAWLAVVKSGYETLLPNQPLLLSLATETLDSVKKALQARSAKKAVSPITEDQIPVEALALTIEPDWNMETLASLYGMMFNVLNSLTAFENDHPELNAEDSKDIYRTKLYCLCLISLIRKSAHTLNSDEFGVPDHYTQAVFNVLSARIDSAEFSNFVEEYATGGKQALIKHLAFLGNNPANKDHIKNTIQAFSDDDMAKFLKEITIAVSEKKLDPAMIFTNNHIRDLIDLIANKRCELYKQEQNALTGHKIEASVLRKKI